GRAPEGSLRVPDDDRSGLVRDGAGRARLLPAPRQGLRLLQRGLPPVRLPVRRDPPGGGSHSTADGTVGHFLAAPGPGRAVSRPGPVSPPAVPSALTRPGAISDGSSTGRTCVAWPGQPKSDRAAGSGDRTRAEYLSPCQGHGHRSATAGHGGKP